MNLRNQAHANFNVLGTINKDLSTSIAATNTVILDANTDRTYAYIRNIGGTTCYLKFAATATTKASLADAIALATSGANSFYEITPDNLYKGIINGYCTVANSVAVLEGEN